MKFVLAILFFTVFAQAAREPKVVTTELIRANRPLLTSTSKALYPFTIFTRGGGRYTFFEPADKLTLHTDGSIYYERKNDLDEIEATGWMDADDMLVSLPVSKVGQFKKGQKICLKKNTAYLKAGEVMKIKDFYENNYVTLYTPGILKVFYPRIYAVSLSEIGTCR